MVHLIGGSPPLPNLETMLFFFSVPWKQLGKGKWHRPDQTNEKNMKKNSTFWWFRMMFPIEGIQTYIIFSSKLLPPISLVGKPKHGIIRVLFSAGAKVKPGFSHSFHSPFHLWANHKGWKARTSNRFKKTCRSGTKATSTDPVPLMEEAPVGVHAA